MTELDQELKQLKEEYTKYDQEKEAWKIIEKAYNYALEAHSGQKRRSGESYITHPLRVAHILAELELDAITIVAGILHDVVEDTNTSFEDIEKKFGSEVAILVNGVTKLSRFDFRSKEEQQAETLRKMFMAMAEDVRVILIKLADRTHNLRTLRHLQTARQKAIAQETLDIYAPLAHRLGIYKIKGEMEDLAFRYLQGDEYYSIVEKLAKKRKEREDFIKKAIIILEKSLKKVSIPAEIHGRPKHLYSIYNKMKEQNKDLSEIYDLTAVRIIVDNVKDCYGALGVVHTIWRPIPGRFKDFIAMPKPNMYQSLHTTVVGVESELIEIQIRTWEMHRTAEYGIAAHWVYKEKNKNEKVFDEKLSWLRQLLEWQQDSRDALEFMENVKLDLFTDEVFVFTPQGDVIDLPTGAIPIDFAFRIHTDVGNRCVGARVNGRLVPLDYQLKTGDIVEVITTKQGSPSRDWLKMVKTSAAKSRIRTWFKKERREENIEKGRERIERELSRQHIDPRDVLKDELIKEVGIKFNIMTVDDLYAAVGYGGITMQQVIGRLKEAFEKKYGTKEVPVFQGATKTRKTKIRANQGVTIHGLDNILVRFARCCSPVPGDDIVGVVTIGRGVSVHRHDCENLRPGRISSERLVQASWIDSPEMSFQVEVEISATDRPKLLSDILASFSEERPDITAVSGKANKKGVSTIQLTIMVRDYKNLQQIINKIKKVDDVYSVRRK